MSEPPLLSVRAATLSRAGSYAVNEDATMMRRADRYTLLAVADGLGGHGKGEVASRLAVDTSASVFAREPSVEGDALKGLVLAAHRALRDAALDERSRNARSTLTVLVVTATMARWAHVGDSRLYHFRGGTLQCRTRDHSVPELLFRAGDIGEQDIRRHPDRNRLLQALGQDADPKVALSDAVSVGPDDAFLLCTDGWWEHVSEAEMETTLHACADPDDWLARMARLIAVSGSDPQDNYSAVGALVSAGRPR